MKTHSEIVNPFDLLINFIMPCLHSASSFRLIDLTVFNGKIKKKISIRKQATIIKNENSMLKPLWSIL